MNSQTMDATSDVSKEKLMQDLHLVVTDAEALLKATAGHAGEKMDATRERIHANLVAAKARLAVAEAAVVARTKDAAKATDVYVHENPWRAVGVAASVGVIVGMLIGRGR
jgi:ElaB/YqjD/DUF883 family membrane-anchored ribosome-binding protein